MPNIDENWTTDPPEVGKRYWIARKPDASHNFYQRPILRFFSAFDVQYWPADHIRSILPIPDPVPPPLPEVGK